MGNATSGAGGTDDPDRVWRRPAPGEESKPATANPPNWLPGSEQDPQRSIWGPDADAGRQPSSPMPVPEPPAWQPPPSGPPQHPSSAPRPAQRWEPEIGSPGDPAWGGPPGPSHVGIDERPAPPPRQPAHERFAGWWARAGIAAAVLAVVIAVIAVASGSDPGDEASTGTSVPSTSSPPTTARRTTTTTARSATTSAAPTTTAGSTADVDPADLAPEDDPRVMLTDLPDGFTALRADLMLKGFQGGHTSSLLFVADGSTWNDGPWIQVGSAMDAAFLGPVTPVDIAGRAGRLGTSDRDAEMVAVDAEGGAVTVSAKGTEPGTAMSMAAALTIGADGTLSVPAGALPPGLRLASGDLAESLTLRRTSSAIVNYRGPGGVGVTVHASLARPGYDPVSVAPFYLSDLDYVTVGSEQGIMGVYRYQPGSTLRSVQWRHGGVDIEVTSFGMEAQDVLALAASASTRADFGWTERQWSAVEDEFPDWDESEPVLVEQALQFGDEGGGTVLTQRRGSGLSWWVEGSTGFGIGRYGQEALPVLLQVAANPVQAIETDGVSHVVALALGDASIEGATVRLRVGALVSGAAEGTEQTAGAPVHPLDAADDDAAGAPSEFGYTLGVAVALPWTEGDFIAELIAADGITVLATATSADLW